MSKVSTCQECNRVFKTTRGLGIHIARTHNPNPKRYELEEVVICTICNRTFKNPQGLKSHNSQKHVISKSVDRMDSVVLCLICRRPFKNYNGLKTHIGRLHKIVKDVKRPYAYQKDTLAELIKRRHRDSDRTQKERMATKKKLNKYFKEELNLAAI